MTRAFKQGFMDMMRKIAQDAGVQPPQPVSPDKKKVDVSAAYTKPKQPAEREPPTSADAGKGTIFNEAAERGLGLHTPVSAEDVSVALWGPKTRQAVLDGGRLASPAALDMAADAAMQKYLDTVAGEPAPRMPTPYELSLFRDAAMAGEDATPGKTPLWKMWENGDTGLYDPLMGAILNPSSPLADRTLRSLWATSTNAVPIKAVSPN